MRRHPKALMLRCFSASAGDVAVKQITRSNFLPALESLRGLVRAADFVALDLEMTGVASAPWREASDFDCAQVRYAKLRDAAARFAAVQLGVCPFRWDPERNAFVAHPHNFFIFPRKYLPDEPSKEFLCQTSSIEFLSKYQFDFNLCIREGISYLSRAQEGETIQKLNAMHRDRLAASFKSLEDNDSTIKRTADLLFVERMKNEFRLWCDNVLSRSNGESSASEELKNRSTEFQTVFYKLRPAIILVGYTSHQLELIQWVVRKHFKDLVCVSTIGDNNKWKKIVVYTETSEDKACLMEEILQDLSQNCESSVQSAVGLRHVIDLLASEKKLIVGHNCLLDIGHLHSKFFGPLPLCLKEFALAVHENFPHIVDTKHLLSASLPFQNLMKHKSKSLFSAYSMLSPINYSSSMDSMSGSHVKIEVQTDNENSSRFISGAKHEAGYDAFMTGAVFAQACSRLGFQFEPFSGKENLALNERLQQYVNLLCTGLNGTVVDLNTGEEKLDVACRSKYPMVQHDNIVLIWGFSSRLRAKDLKECICKVFGQDSVTSVYSVDTSAALILFKEKGSVDDFLSLKETVEKSTDAVSVLHPLFILLEGGQMRAARYQTYREICRSPVSKILFAHQAETVGASLWPKSEHAYFQDLDDSKRTEYAYQAPVHQHQVKILSLKKNCDVTYRDVIDSLFRPNSKADQSFELTAEKDDHSGHKYRQETLDEGQPEESLVRQAQ